MKLQIYSKEKKAALKAASEKLTAMPPFDRLKLAIKMNVSINTLHSYRSGTGKSFEMALKILEA